MQPRPAMVEIARILLAFEVKKAAAAGMPAKTEPATTATEAPESTRPANSTLCQAQRQRAGAR